MPLLTLSMIVRNEESYLRQCLESIKDAADEIVIVDTGSTDRTLEVASEYGAKILSFNWINDFSAARNIALKNSTGKWILYLDADEHLSEKSISELKRIIEDDNNIGVRCIVNSPDDFSNKSVIMKYTRLFKNNPSIEFTGSVHEQIDESLLKNGYKIVDSEIEIIHEGYNVPPEEKKKKAERNLFILNKEYENNKSSYYAYQLGNTYDILEDEQNAAKYFRIALSGNKISKDYKSVCCLNLSAYELSKHNISEAAKIVEQGLKCDPTNPMLNLLASQVYLRSSKINESIQACKNALEYNGQIKSGRNTSILSIGLNPEKIIYQGIYLSVVHNKADSLQFFLNTLLESGRIEEENIIRKILMQTILNEKEMNILEKSLTVDSLQAILLLLEKYNYKQPVLRILEKVKERFSGFSKYLIALGRAYLENNYLDKAITLFEESMNLKEKDPSAVFYLVSAYIRKNDFDRIISLIKTAEDEFSQIKEFNLRFRILKQKIDPILQQKL